MYVYVIATLTYKLNYGDFCNTGQCRDGSEYYRKKSCIYMHENVSSLTKCA